MKTTERFSPTEVRHAFTAKVAGRVGALHDRSALAALTEQLLGARLQAAVSGGPIAYLSA
ncbi:hypothetical protein [Streptomyces sp. NPDC057636]|uniref:hypothetical protein n=1 Tax=Streptomyces sp. NPDC057636 TaxID=3346189 RepID=UPI00369B02B5